MQITRIKYVDRKLVNQLTEISSFLLTLTRENLHRAGQPIGLESSAVPFYFLLDQQGTGSTAQQEWHNTKASHPQEMQRIGAHVLRVEAAKAIPSFPLRQAYHIPGHGKPDLYAWGSNGVWVFYTYDGTDLVVVLVGIVIPPPAFPDLRVTATGRI